MLQYSNIFLLLLSDFFSLGKKSNFKRIMTRVLEDEKIFYISFREGENVVKQFHYLLRELIYC